MLPFVGHPGPQPAHRIGGRQGVRGVDVHVVVVDGGGHRDLVGRQGVGGVEVGPVRALGQQLRRLLQGAQRRVGLEHPGVDHLSGEAHRGAVRQRPGGVELGELRADLLRRPAGRARVHRPLAVDGLVQDGVEGAFGERELRLGAAQEGVGQLRPGAAPDPGVLQQVVQGVRAAARAEQQTERLERPHGQPSATGQLRGRGGQVLGDPPHRLDVLRVAGVVRGILAGHPRVGRPVHVGRAAAQPRQSAGDHGLAHALGGQREVGEGAEAAEALPEQAPLSPLAEQLAPDQLGVADDRVGPEAGEVVGLLGRAAAQRQGLPGRRGRAPGAALVEQQDPVVVQGPVQPAVPAQRPARPAARAALEVEQPGQVGVLLARRDHLAGVDLDPLALRRRVVQRQLEEMVGQDDARLSDHHGHETPRSVLGAAARG